MKGTPTSAVAFTGHRPESLPFGNDEQSEGYCKLKSLLLAEIKHWADKGYDTYYQGVARGADIAFGEQVLLAKEQGYPHIKLIGVIPHEGQANRWSEAWRDRYFDLMAKSDDEIMISSSYDRGVYHRRNRYMIDHADVLIAVYNGTPSGGTAYTVNYALKQGKTVIVIDPASLERRIVPPKE